MALLGALFGGILVVSLLTALLAKLPVPEAGRPLNVSFASIGAGAISIGLASFSGSFTPSDLALNYALPSTCIAFGALVQYVLKKRPAMAAAVTDSESAVRDPVPAVSVTQLKRGRIGRWFWATPQRAENGVQTVLRVAGNLLR